MADWHSDKKMKKSEIKIGGQYIVKIGGQLTIVRIVAESNFGGWSAVDLNTWRMIHIRAIAKLHNADEYLADK